MGYENTFRALYTDNNVFGLSAKIDYITDKQVWIEPWIEHQKLLYKNWSRSLESS